jgi:hypothetical protein
VQMLNFAYVGVRLEVEASDRGGCRKQKRTDLESLEPT